MFSTQRRHKAGRSRSGPSQPVQASLDWQQNAPLDPRHRAKLRRNRRRQSALVAADDERGDEGVEGAVDGDEPLAVVGRHKDAAGKPGEQSRGSGSDYWPACTVSNSTRRASVTRRDASRISSETRSPFAS